MVTCTLDTISCPLFSSVRHLQMSHIDCQSAPHCNVGASVTCQLALEINVKASHLLLVLPSSGRARLSLSDTLKAQRQVHHHDLLQWRPMRRSAACCCCTRCVTWLSPVCLVPFFPRTSFVFPRPFSPPASFASSSDDDDLHFRRLPMPPVRIPLQVNFS